MNPILELLDAYLKANPQIRFTQALFNLDINQFAEEKPTSNFRDNYNDTDDDVLKRVKKLLN